MNAKKFKNFTDREFTWKFDGIPHTFPAGMEIYLEDYKADHFAKHLVDEEMNRMGLRTNNMVKRQELIDKCFPTDEVISQSDALQINEKAQIKVEQKVEKEFEDLEKPEESKVPVVQPIIKKPRGRPKKHE